MSNQAVKLVQSNPEVAAIDDKMAKLQAEINALKAEKKEKTRGLAVSLNRYVDKKDGQPRCGLQVLGITARPVLMFRDQIMRLVGDTAEAEANRKFIREFVAANESHFTRKEEKK